MMRHIKDRHAASPQLLDHRELRHFTRGEACRRLVEDQDRRILNQGFGDFEHPPLGDAEGMDRRIRVQ